MTLIRKQVMMYTWLDTHVRKFSRKHDISYSNAIRYLTLEGLMYNHMCKDFGEHAYQSRKVLEK